MKTCPRCQRTQPFTCFGRNKTLPDGLSYYCLDCNREKAREWYRTQVEKTGRTLRERDDSPPGFKRCSACRRVLPESDFHSAAGQPRGRATYCKGCRSELQKVAHLRQKYGLSPEELSALLLAQGDVCAICRVRPAEHVDHDHATGQVRGVLCFPCNVALGHLRDDVSLFKNAIDYLERTTWQSPDCTDGSPPPSRRQGPAASATS